MKTGHEIIEAALIDAISDAQNFPFGMSLEHGDAYKKGLVAAYQHALEMIPDLQSHLESLEKGLLDRNEACLSLNSVIQRMAEDNIKRCEQMQALEKDAETMRSALEDIASGEVTRSYCHGPECFEQVENANAEDMASRAAGALSWLDAAMQSAQERGD